ncbi:MAG: two-component regulator propeller domain-containing protein [Mangrovibacterium sp.]
MIFKFKIVIACIFALLNTIPFQVRAANDVQFFNLNSEYEISIRETNQVCSDDNGFIWISSKMGILRYTQDDIRIYQLPYETADIITVRLVYKDAVLYAFTNNGQIFKYDAIQDIFELEINIAKELRNPYIIVTQLLVDGRGRMWLSSSFGLYCYDPETGLKSLAQAESVHSLEWFDDHSFFYAIDGQIRLYNTLDFSSSDYFVFPKGTNYFVSHFLFDKGSNTLWVGTRADGLFYLKDANGRMSLSGVSELPNQPILAIEAISDSTMLIGIDGQGIWEINEQGNRVLNIFKEDSDNPNSLKGNGVYDIYRDKNDRVWVCTYSGGVSYFDQANPIVTKINHVVNNPNSLVTDDVNSILEDMDGNLWFATNNGISYWNVRTNRWKSFYHNKREQAQVFLSLCEDDQGRIWAGSYSSGVYLLDSKTARELAHYSPDATKGEFGCNFIFDIHKDTRGDIWIGGVNGDLICYQPKKDRFKSFPDMTIYVMADYGPDKLLIGTTYGLLLFDKANGNTQTLLEGYLVYDILLKNNVVWLCTSGDGVIRYDLKSKLIHRYSVDSGLPSNFVNSIVFSNGYFWIGTEQGLSRLNEMDNTILTFTSLSDLSNVSFNQNSYYTLRNGKLIWGTNTGALVFDPNEIQPKQDEGRIFFQDLTVSGRSIRESSNIKLNSPLDSLQELSLNYYQNTVSLELIPIGVTSPGSKFSWKLEGLDQEWSKPVNNRILSYSNIPSGTYSLRIRMVDSSLTTVVAERVITLHMIPPIWEEWWFKMLVFVFIVGLGVFLFVYYVDRLKKQHSEEKIRFFANTAHDIRTSLTLISGPIEELHKEPGLSNKGLQYLHWATEQAQRLSKVVTQLMDFQKVDIGKEKLSLSMVDIVKIIENRVMMFESYANSKNVELRFTTNFSKFVTAMDESMIEKVIDNLISNAIKYSYPNKPVQVDLQCFSNKWILEVKDQGIGISKKVQRQLFHEYYRGDNAVNSKIVGSGIGLLLVKNYVNLHEGKVSCVSQLNVGSAFQVVMPVKRIDEAEMKQKSPDEKVVQPLVQKKDMHSVMMNGADPGTNHKMKVLIVEDHDYLREFLQSAMDPQFQITLAEDGQQAWELIQKETPDLVVSDIMMPNMDGFELCSKLKSTYETSHIPIILLTSLSGKAQQMKGLGLGADDYLTKPFDVTLLQQRIRTIIQNREVIREKALKIIKVNEDETILDNELNDKFLKRMVEVVRENLANSQFSKNDFASAMNVSPSLLYKKIKSLTDQSPTDFIKSIRLDHALELLQTKKYSITEVSELCGFASVGYFSTVFRKHYGKSPTQVC